MMMDEIMATSRSSWGGKYHGQRPTVGPPLPHQSLLRPELRPRPEAAGRFQSSQTYDGSSFAFQSPQSSDDSSTTLQPPTLQPFLLPVAAPAAPPRVLGRASPPHSARLLRYFAMPWVFQSLSPRCHRRRLPFSSWRFSAFSFFRAATASMSTKLLKVCGLTTNGRLTLTRLAKAAMISTGLARPSSP